MSRHEPKPLTCRRAGQHTSGTVSLRRWETSREPFPVRDHVLYRPLSAATITTFSRPKPVISFEKVDYRILAYYRLDRNPQGLLDEITFNTVHLERSEWGLLETLAHEQLHLKQQNFGEHPVKRNYHNKEFCRMAEAIGLHVFPVIGFHYAPADGPFALLMARYGTAKPEPVMVPKGEKRHWWQMGKERREGRSTMSKWQCPCGQIVRVGKREWPGAVCNACGDKYAKVEGRASRTLYAGRKEGP